MFVCRCLLRLKWDPNEASTIRQISKNPIRPLEPDKQTPSFGYSFQYAKKS